MVYILALGAALSNALTSVFQRMGVEDAPESDRLRPRLLLNALRRSIWLGGFAFMILSFVCQATALHMGRLTIVQPVLTTELLFLVLILGTWFEFTIGPREWAGALAASMGLAGFLIFADPLGGNLVPTRLDWIEVVVPCSVIMAICVGLATRGPRWWRATMFGTAAAVAYAVTAAFTKTIGNVVATDWTRVLFHWQTYGLIVFGIMAVFLTQNAYHAGPIAASQSTIVLIDPLASILIGVGLFGDDLRTGGAAGPFEALSLLVLFIGAIVLCRSPLVSGVKGDSEHSAELLTVRLQHHRDARAARDETTARGVEFPAEGDVRHVPGT